MKRWNGRILQLAARSYLVLIQTPGCRSNQCRYTLIIRQTTTATTYLNLHPSLRYHITVPRAQHIGLKTSHFPTLPKPTANSKDSKFKSTRETLSVLQGQPPRAPGLANDTLYQLPASQPSSTSSVSPNGLPAEKNGGRVELTSAAFVVDYLAPCRKSTVSITLKVSRALKSLCPYWIRPMPTKT